MYSPAISIQAYPDFPDALWCRNFKEDAELFQAVGVDKRNKPHEGFEFHYKVNFNSGFGLSAQNVEFKPPCLCRSVAACACNLRLSFMPASSSCPCPCSFGSLHARLQLDKLSMG